LSTNINILTNPRMFVERGSDTITFVVSNFLPSIVYTWLLHELLRRERHFNHLIQGCSKRSIHIQKFILQALLNIWFHSIYRLKGELSKLFSHLTNTRCEPHMWRGRCHIDNPALPHTPRSMSQVTAATASVMHRFRSSISELWENSFPSDHRAGYGFRVGSFCKTNLWKFILIFNNPA
jgi:hypothetical protein